MANSLVSLSHLELLLGVGGLGFMLTCSWCQTGSVTISNVIVCQSIEYDNGEGRTSDAIRGNYAVLFYVRN